MARREPQRPEPQIMDGFMLRKRNDRAFPWSKWAKRELTASPTPEESLQNLENEINSWLYGYDPIPTRGQSSDLV